MFNNNYMAYMALGNTSNIIMCIHTPRFSNDHEEEPTCLYKNESLSKKSTFMSTEQSKRIKDSYIAVITD